MFAWRWASTQQDPGTQGNSAGAARAEHGWNRLGLGSLLRHPRRSPARVQGLNLGHGKSGRSRRRRGEILHCTQHEGLVTRSPDGILWLIGVHVFQIGFRTLKTNGKRASFSNVIYVHFCFPFSAHNLFERSSCIREMTQRKKKYAKCNSI